MNNEFVSYEIAKAMKELGFKVKCISFYWTDGMIYKGYTKSFNHNKNNNLISRPIYQQAFNWFRKEHGLVFLLKVGVHEYSYDIWNEREDKEHESTNNMDWIKRGFNGTYEEVQVHALIKLIGIVKEK